MTAAPLPNVSAQRANQAANSAPIGDDARAELIAEAQRHERRNRPRHLVLLAGIVAVAAAGYLIWATLELRERASALATARAEVQTLTNLGGQLRAVLAEMDSPEMRARLDPTVSVFSELNQRATDAGLIAGANLRIEESATIDPIKDTDLVRKKWNITLQAQPADAIFRWLAKVSEINGLEVTFINELKPGAGTPEGEPRFDCRLIFARIQKRPAAK